MSPELPIRLVVGLGNPGRGYMGTRHNVGFAVIDRLAARKDCKLQPNRQFGGEIGSSSGIFLLKPQTFMNLSGQAVGHVARFYKLEPAQCLIIVDDVALEIGRLRLRKSGSAGGHNGLTSIIEHLGSDQFARLRVGVGAVGERMTLSDHVLSTFLPIEQEKVERELDRAADAVEHACSSGLEAAMNLFNPAPQNL